MATILGAVVVVMVVGTALGLVRRSQRRIAALERELDDVYQAQRILDRARDRKDRKHLHLLGLVPLAWLFRSSHARLAAATGISAAVVGMGFTGNDTPTHQNPLHPIPPAAAAETLENTPAAVDTPAYSYGTPPTPTVRTTTSTVAAEAVVPPSASAVVEAGSAPTEPPSSTVPAPSTTTTLPVEVEVPRVCITPAITILDACAGG